MPQYFAFLRAINVGGHTIKMDTLRGYFNDLGFEQVETFIASGNVIFSADEISSKMEIQIEKYLIEKLGYSVATFIRTMPELQKIAACQPFSQETLAAAEAYNVAFLKSPLDDIAALKLSRMENNIDRFAGLGREMYWICTVKQSQSKFSNVIFEKAIGQPATMRQITTIQKLIAKYGIS